MTCETPRHITGVKLWLNPQIVSLTFSDGVDMDMTFAEANKRVRVNGIPIIDFYAKMN